MRKTFTGLCAAVALFGLFATPAAASQLETALAEGGTKLTAEEITTRLADKTVTFENLNSGAKALVYYDGGNGTIIKPIGADQELEGFYATDLADHVCVGVYGETPCACAVSPWC